MRGGFISLARPWIFALVARGCYHADTTKFYINTTLDAVLLRTAVALLIFPLFSTFEFKYALTKNTDQPRATDIYHVCRGDPLLSITTP